MGVKFLKILVCGLFFWSLNAHLWGKQDNSFWGLLKKPIKAGIILKPHLILKKHATMG